jgi:hypothetical protein
MEQVHAENLMVVEIWVNMKPVRGGGQKFQNLSPIEHYM